MNKSAKDSYEICKQTHKVQVIKYFSKKEVILSNIESLQWQENWIKGPKIEVKFHLSPFGVNKIQLNHSPVEGMLAEIWSQDKDLLLNEKIEFWLDQYSKGKHSPILFPLDFQNLPFFTKDVLIAMQTIAFGTVCTYGDVASMVRAPKAARAVGSACRRNPFPLIIPCHRVIDAGKNLRGYSAGGLEIKKLLLEFEKVTI
jgi:methylated-DNA-[protein]-cysteine S-methyltransferase